MNPAPEPVAWCTSIRGKLNAGRTSSAAQDKMWVKMRVANPKRLATRMNTSISGGVDVPVSIIPSRIVMSQNDV